MSKLVNINAGEFNPTVNFWEQNPHMILITPWNELYALDGGEDESSKMAWTVHFIGYPDEEENKFYKFGKENIEQMFIETYFKGKEPDWKNEAYNKCVEAYPEQCLNAIQKAFKMKKESLIKLGSFLNNQELTLDNIKDIVTVQSKVPKLYEEYETIEEKFFAGKQRARVKGGRRESKAERKEI